MLLLVERVLAGRSPVLTRECDVFNLLVCLCLNLKTMAADEEPIELIRLFILRS